MWALDGGWAARAIGRTPSPATAAAGDTKTHAVVVCPAHVLLDTTQIWLSQLETHHSACRLAYSSDVYMELMCRLFS